MVQFTFADVTVSPCDCQHSACTAGIEPGLRKSLTQTESTRLFPELGCFCIGLVIPEDRAFRLSSLKDGRVCREVPGVAVAFPPGLGVIVQHDGLGAREWVGNLQAIGAVVETQRKAGFQD
ncbi:hypothetical protein D3C84_994310 [compost metagenome]